MDKKYFAADESSACVSYLKDKADKWVNYGANNGYTELVKRSWRTYHGFNKDANHQISFDGEQGELLKININHFYNIAEHILVMITANRPRFQARAINTDKKSLIQAQLANGLLDYYMREKRLEREIKRAVRCAVVLGCGYIKMEWNSTKGEIYDYIEPSESSIAGYNEDGEPIDSNGNVLKPIPVYQGDIDFKMLDFFNVFFDTNKESPELHDWVVTRTMINKYDLAEKYPDMADRITGMSLTSDSNGTIFTLSQYDESTDIPVYEFFHNKTESVPEGRHIIYLDKDIVLSDSILEYDRIPVYRISPNDILGTSFGFSPMFNLIELQEYLNMLYSTVLTNQHAFGVQNVLSPIGSDIKYTQLSSGMNFIEYNPNFGKPEALNLTSTPKEIFETIQYIEKAMETISAVNATVRGNPESQLRSGTSLAHMSAQALQFMSGLQQSYIQLLEDVGTGVVNLLKKFASAPRIAAIVGLRNTTNLVEFKSEDLSGINRVVVDVGNALMATHAGRAQVAENLLQAGLIKQGDKYVQILQTGNLDVLVESEMDELNLIRGENEELVKGEIEVSALAYDNHVLHIQEHRSVAADSKLRQDVNLLMRLNDHIKHHLDLAKNIDPTLAQILGQPVFPPEAPQMPEEGAAPQPPTQGGTPELQANPEAQSVAPEAVLEGGPNLPRSPDDSLPVNPAELFAKNASE